MGAAYKAGTKLHRSALELQMNHWERLQAAIRGEAVDRPPISLWRHWPQIDQDPAPRE